MALVSGLSGAKEPERKSPLTVNFRCVGTCAHPNHPFRFLFPPLRWWSKRRCTQLLEEELQPQAQSCPPLFQVSSEPPPWCRPSSSPPACTHLLQSSQGEGVGSKRPIPCQTRHQWSPAEKDIWTSSPREGLTFPGGPGRDRKNPRGGRRQACSSEVIEFKVTLYNSPGRIKRSSYVFWSAFNQIVLSSLVV